MAKPTKLKTKLICSICGNPIKPHPLSGWAGGNNAEPLNSGRCCDSCDGKYVIPYRIALIVTREKKGA